MINGRLYRAFSLLALVAMLPGCLGPNEKLWYLGDADLNYYEQASLEVAHASVDPPVPEEVELGTRPRTLTDRTKDEIWDMTLAEAIQIALSNAEVIRSRGQFRSPGNPLLANPQTAPSVYDPAIQETGVLFGTRGVESALAAFDTTFTTSMIWGRNEQVQNNAFFGGGLAPGNTLAQETGDFDVGLSKTFATGGQLNLTHNWDYLGSNVPGQLFPSSYRGGVGANYRHPLWAGSGTEFTRIAGPITQQFGGLSGVTQGVVIARINGDITVAEFEENVRNLVRDVEDLYWELYLQYRLYDTAVTTRNSVLRSWREAQAKLELGGIVGFKPADEAQARDAYFTARAATETTLATIYSTETEFRRLLGLPVNDGRIIRPQEEPTTAQLEPDWYVSLAEALSQRVELRKQKWNIQSLELQLTAANSLTKPRLDFVSGYQVNGFGDRLFGENDNDGRTAQGFRSAYETITQGNQTGWNLGFELTMPLGFRQAHAQVRNVELRLAKARKVLAAQELDISHELAVTMQNLASQYRIAQTNYNRREAAKRRVELFEAELEAGTATLDLVLRAQASLAEAESAYYTSLIRYNQSLIDLQFRKGTLLEHNNILLAESAWTPEAYDDALRRAWARSHAFDNPLLHTEPPEFALPAFQRHVEMPGVERPGPGVVPVPDDEVPPPAPPAGDEPESVPAEGLSAPPAAHSDRETASGVRLAHGDGKPAERGGRGIRTAVFERGDSLFRDGDALVEPEEALDLNSPGDVLE
ncbi:MAG: TolC family protein [Planctomycetales bacterium]